jgi:hypothetical protein
MRFLANLNWLDFRATTVHPRMNPNPTSRKVGQASACLLLIFAARKKFKTRQAEACPTKRA